MIVWCVLKSVVDLKLEKCIWLEAHLITSYCICSEVYWVFLFYPRCACLPGKLEFWQQRASDVWGDVTCSEDICWCVGGFSVNYSRSKAVGGGATIAFNQNVKNRKRKIMFFFYGELNKRVY